MFCISMKIGKDQRNMRTSFGAQFEMNEKNFFKKKITREISVLHLIEWFTTKLRT